MSGFGTICERRYPVVALFLLSALVVSVRPGYALHQRYHTYEEVLAELDSLHNAFPEITHLDSIGHTTRDSLAIWCLKISDNAHLEEDEPGILLLGNQHADEILGVEILMWMLDNLLRRYETHDARAIAWIEELEIYVVPMWNAEGHVVVEQGLTWWRKTKRDNNGNHLFDYHDGVDLNRNFPLGWEEADSIPENFFYRGPAPFSEAEAQAVRDLSRRKRFIITVDYHSPTYGRPEVLYFPWYRTERGGYAPDRWVVERIAYNMASRIIRDSGIGHYQWMNCGAGNGYHRTWQYEHFAAVAFTIEVSDTTIQDPDMVDGICRRNLPGIYYLFDRAGGPGLTGVVTDAGSSLPLEAEVVVEEAYHAEIAPRTSDPVFGRFRRLLQPGVYTLRVERECYHTQICTHVVVRDGTWTELNVELEPILVSAPEVASVPRGFLLEQNHPNPFNQSTVITYHLPTDAPVSLEVFDLLGRVVAAFPHRLQVGGLHSITWEAGEISSGIYFYRLTSGGHSLTRRMILLR
jgi:hypothetical protein